jgi:iron complex outermembrane recepter protein
MKKTLFLALLALFLAGKPLFAAEKDYSAVDLEKIVVTPYRYEEALDNTAASVSVVTSKDIAEYYSTGNVADALRDVPGVVVSDVYGNGAKPTVDIAGFGGQAALNVLVLLDGRRLNDVDLSGVDWSQIPLDQVERIEIIRGSSAAVLYGDNASGGVINIITKKGWGGPKVKLQAQAGSFAQNSQKLSLAGKADKLSYWLYGQHEATNGYRKNSFNKTKNFSSQLNYELNDTQSIHLDSGYYSASYGMPGSLWQEYIDRFSRRFAKHGDDHANNLDYYFVLGSKKKIFELGELSVDFSYRRKDTDSFFLTSKLNTQKNKIDTFGITPKYTLDREIYGHGNKLIAGLDYYRVYFRSDKLNRLIDSDLKNVTRTNKTSLGAYLQDEFSLFKPFNVVGGYRYEAARYAFNYHDLNGWNPDIETKVHPQERIFNAGLVYNFQPDSSAFFNVAKSFRFPEVDEFTYNDASWQQQLNTGLRPQTALNYELGARHKFSDRLSGEFSLYRMKVRDELYYNSIGGPMGQGQNENYDQTVHQGMQASLDARLSGWLGFFGNYAFTDAFFKGGPYDKNEIPMVPRHKASAGLKFFLPRDFLFCLTGTYVGPRRFLNDQANAYSRLNGYMVADTSLSWKHQDLTLTLGIDNLLDRKYAEVAGVVVNDSWESSTGLTWPAGTKFYYPSPERNFNLKAEYEF